MSRVSVIKSKALWLLIVAACVIAAALSSFTAYLRAQLAGKVNWRDVFVGPSLWLAFALLTWIPYSLARRFPVKRERIVLTLAIHFAGALAMSLCWTVGGLIIGWIVLRRTPQALLRLFPDSFLTNLPLCVFLYFAVLGCIHAFSYYQEAREREAQQSRLAAQLAEAKLSALRMQLNPHFLFNSLNAITVLVRDQKTREASKVLRLLSGMLRRVLQTSNRSKITLNEEIEFIKKYLEIEQVRFPDRLHIQLEVESAVGEALVPEFILQPLVENAVRHGIAKRVEPGEVQVSAHADNGDLVLSVRDSGPGYHPGSAGLGLANIRERLETLYGETGSLIVTSGETGGTIATVRFPFKKQVDE